MAVFKKKEKNVYAATGISTKEDPSEAGREAVQMAISNMKSQGCKEGPDFGFLFCSGGKYSLKGDKHMQKLVDAAHKQFVSENPNCQWIGCTTASEISTQGYSKESVVAMVIRSEFIKVGIGVGLRVDKDPAKAAKQAFDQATKHIHIDKQLDAYIQYMTMQRKSTSELIKYSPYHLITLIQGPLKKPGREDEFIHTLRKVAGPTVPITGGSSADDFNFKASYCFYDGKIYKEAAIVMAMVSHVKISTGTESGFKPTDKTYVVTKCKGRVVQELNNRPAAEVLAEGYGSTVDELSAWHTSGYQNCFFLNEKHPILINAGPGVYRVAVFHMVNPDKSVVLGSGVAEHEAITIGEATRQEVIRAAPKALKEAMDNVGGKLAAVICFDCDLRLMALKEDIVKEHKEMKKVIKKTPIIGFYTNGEQCFLGDSSACHVNYTITCLAISDVLMS